MICSLTKAAAHEISGRGIPIADDMVGTLHAHCYRSLGAPALAESNLKDWNEKHPQLAVSSKADLGDSVDGIADDALATINMERAKMTDYSAWPVNVKMFYNKWEEWKEANGYMDFTDMIEACIENGGTAHGNPSILLGDEAQDWSKLEFKLFVETWGKHADTVVLAGDFDQCIYDWRGADPHYFASQNIPQENKIVRGQSFRLPRKVHARAVGWIRRIKNREDVEYRPTDREGKVQEAEISLKHKHELVDEIQKLVKDGKTVMVLTSCAYMLNGVISVMREKGMPFCNQYRKRNGRWNPLARRKNAVMPVDRISAFLAPKLWPEDNWRKNSMRKWSEDEFRQWALALKTDIFRYGVKTKIKQPFFRLPESFGEYNLLFKEEKDAHESLFSDIGWYKKSLANNFAKSVGYACDVANNNDLGSITKVPTVTVGTIHSVKGGEADCVFLFPDLSFQGMAQWDGAEEEQDSIRRVFYVGMTRAKEELILCRQSNRLAVEF